MQSNSLSYEFQFIQIFVASFFWVLNWIPGVNFFSNAIYWIYWVIIFIFKYKPLLVSIVKSGASIGKIGVKIGFISSIAFILGEIPLVSIAPWNVIANFWIKKLIKKLLIEVEKIKRNADNLKKAWQNNQRSFELRNTYRRNFVEKSPLQRTPM